MNGKRSGRMALAVLGVAAAVAAGERPAAAQQPGAMAPATARTIRVSGQGDVQARPDEARIQLAVESFASSAREAGRDNARVMERVIRALVAAGVPRGEIETQNYSVYPEYEHEEGVREPRIRGYRAVNQVALETTELERVGELIDVALNAGANRMEGVSFQLRDADAAQAEALREAVQRARASAEAIAGALGVRLGPVLDASTTMQPYQPIPAAMYRMESRDAAAAPPPTPIQPGEQTLHAMVTLVFEIQ